MPTLWDDDLHIPFRVLFAALLCQRARPGVSHCPASGGSSDVMAAQLGPQPVTLPLLLSWPVSPGTTASIAWYLIFWILASGIEWSGTLCLVITRFFIRCLQDIPRLKSHFQKTCGWCLPPNITVCEVSECRGRWIVFNSGKWWSWKVPRNICICHTDRGQTEIERSFGQLKNY